MSERTVDDVLHVIDNHIDALRGLAVSPVGRTMPDRLAGALDSLRDVRESVAHLKENSPTAVQGPPVAFTPDRVRTELLASLSADPKWVAWVDGVLDRLPLAEGVTLTPEEKAVAAAALRWALLNPGEDETRSDWRPRFRALAERLEGTA